jgi:hypothetical protein
MLRENFLDLKICEICFRVMRRTIFVEVNDSGLKFVALPRGILAVRWCRVSYFADFGRGIAAEF